MLSLVKVEHPAPCEGCGHGRRARNKVYLCGHEYMLLCHDCLMEHAQIAIDNAPVFGSTDKQALSEQSQPKFVEAA